MFAIVDRDMPRRTAFLASVVNKWEGLNFAFGDCHSPNTSDIAEFKLLTVR